MNRRQGAIVILLAWTGALGWLAHRELSAGRGGGTSGWPVPPGSSFQAIRLGRRQIGVATLTVDTIPEGVRVVELTTVDLPRAAPSVPRRATHRLEALYSRGLTLLAWDSDLLTESGRERAGGRIENDSMMTVVLSPANHPPETLSVRLPGPVILPGAVTLAVAARGIPRRGALYEFSVLDPLEIAVRGARYTVQQESLFTIPDSADFNPSIRRWEVAHTDTVRAWRLDGVEQGLPVARWTDAAGQPVRVVHALGATMERSAFELVNTNFRSVPPTPWEIGPAIPSFSVARLPQPAELYDWVALQLTPQEALPTVLPALDGGYQRRSGDTLYPAVPLATGPPAASPESSSPLVEPDSVIRALAGGLRLDASEAGLKALEQYLGRAVVLRVGPGSSSAAATLRRGSGNEAERATVAVAMAREAGFPARRAWGLRHEAGAWQLRTWAEVWVDGWTPVEAGGGARPGDRVRLGMGRGVGLADLAIRTGRLRLEFARGRQ